MKRDFLLVFKYFLIWRVVLFLLAAASLYLIPTFGARFPYWDRVLTITGLPNWIWGFGNFDGVHYLRIAQNGYTSEFTSAFFPLFPFLIKLFSVFFPRTPGLDLRIYTDPSYFYSGIFISNAFFIAALYMFYKLIKIDYAKSFAKKSLILLLVFPTSFYFGAVYTESLFLFFAVTSVYFIRKQKFLLASIFMSLATATRIIGVFLILIYLIEVIKTLKGNSLINKTRLKIILGFLIAPIGLVVYSLFLNTNYGDPLYFLSVQPKFGADRSSSLVLLPQVLYRYVKIFLNVPFISLGAFNAFLELLFTLLPLMFLLFYIKKIRLSYWIFSLSSLILPTLTGTLSSMPRYVLMAFLVLPVFVQILDKHFKLFVLIFILLGVVLLSLFIRGYWVA